MKTQQTSRVSISEALKKPADAGAAGKKAAGESLEELCKCEVMQPGTLRKNSEKKLNKY
jgi:hypothetical protein